MGNGAKKYMITGLICQLLLAFYLFGDITFGNPKMIEFWEVARHFMCFVPVFGMLFPYSFLFRCNNVKANFNHVENTSVAAFFVSMSYTIWQLYTRGNITGFSSFFSAIDNLNLFCCSEEAFYAMICVDIVMMLLYCLIRKSCCSLWVYIGAILIGLTMGVLFVPFLIVFLICIWYENNSIEHVLPNLPEEMRPTDMDNYNDWLNCANNGVVIDYCSDNEEEYIDYNNLPGNPQFGERSFGGYIRNSYSSNNKILYNIDGRYIREGYSCNSKILYNIDGCYIREGYSPNSKILYNIDGHYIREGYSSNSKILYNIDGSYIREGYSCNNKIVANID